ncbi:MAG: hypothetical protein IKG91_00395 [Firmicutes bacterium]|nr:hypothetical protein [Bacillota bacterium]
MNEKVLDKIEQTIPLLQEVRKNLLEALALAEREAERTDLSEDERDEVNMFVSQLQIACDSADRALDDTDDMVSR